MSSSNSPTYPLLWLSLKNWKGYTHDLIRFDNSFSGTGHELLGHVFVDTTGTLFKAGKLNHFSKWKRALPWSKSGSIEFAAQGERIELPQLKAQMLEKISALGNEHSTREWRYQVEQAESYTELFVGQQEG